MGTHYLVDLHDNPIATARINDVNVPLDGRSLCNGSFVVRVPPGVSVQDPANLADLKTKKYAGLLVWYAGFTTLDYDDLLDAVSVDMTDPQTAGKFGERATIGLNPGARLTSAVVPLSGAAPTQAVVTWETFEYEDVDSSSSRLLRSYHELDPDPVTSCEVSFDGGLNFIAVTDGDGGVVNIPLGMMGTNFIIRITNTSSQVVMIGSWAVIY